MKTFYPYQIHHLALEKDLHSIHKEWDLLSKEYLVFWWKGIPLGHFFLDSPKREQNAPPMIVALKMVFETLLQQPSGAILIDPLKEKIAQLDQEGINKILAEILQELIQSNLPANVDLSIVICTRNRSVDLRKCLEALEGMLVKASEIIVVDNDPEDDSTEKVVKNFKNVIYLKENRKGLDIARNTGAMNARFPIIAYLDDDVIPDHHWLFQISSSFKDPDIDAVTGLVLPLQLGTESQYIFEKFWSFNKGYKRILFTKDFLKSQGNDCPKVWNIGAGANMAFRKSMLDKVGYFDERLDAGAAGCSGDSEIWFRILLSDGKIFYNPLVVVHHNHRSDMKGLKRQLHNYMKGNVVASLIQHKQDPSLNFSHHVYVRMPKNYLFHILRKIKSPGLRHKTVLNEAGGVISGLWYYFKNKNRTHRIR